MDKNQLEVKVGEQQDYIDRLEAAILVFGGFKGTLEIAETRKMNALDIGISTVRLRTVIDLCEEIHAREAGDEQVA